MPKNCSIPGCTSRRGEENYKNVSLHPLPSRSPSLFLTTYICSLHFQGGERSKEHAIPTVFPWNEPSKLRNPPKPRESLPPPKRRETEQQELQHALITAEGMITKPDETIKELKKEMEVLKAEKVEAFGVQ